ncbi:MAG TPA: hypothetical protein VHT03_11945 [Rhizomicrobium sp.]|jgi:hypothetical protein|nr:hypothetical protein [Rhizomicrobium sp.]
MKLTFLPTLTDMREMLGDRLYVEFVWAWREQEQEKRQKENRARWADQLPQRTSHTWPQPLVVRDITEEEAPEPMPAHVALLHPNKRLLEQKKAAAADMDGATRLRTAGIRSAAE